jgi:glycosyltransferase involved in cell wall biosynthesis
MSAPLATVLMATFNQAEYLPAAIDSLKEQTLSREDFEVVVVNDGSTDATSEILRAHDDWLRLVERDNRGLVASCNEGLALARGRYLARLDSDDQAHPRWLESLVEAMEANGGEACCAYPDRYEVGAGGRSLVSPEGNNLYTLVACGTLFRTEALKAIGGYRPFYWEEYDLYLRLRRAGSFIHVKEPLYVYRKHGAAMTSSKARRQSGWRELAREWGAATLRSAGQEAEMEEVLEHGQA